jgi:hypothetical protein
LFFYKNHDFSRFLINFSTVVVVKHTHVVDPKRLTARRRLELQRYHFSEVETGGAHAE